LRKGMMLYFAARGQKEQHKDNFFGNACVATLPVHEFHLEMKQRIILKSTRFAMRQFYLFAHL